MKEENKIESQQQLSKLISEILANLKNNKQTIIAVLVTPKSSKNEIVHIAKAETLNTQEWQLKIKIKGLPVKGEVNKNLLKYLAKILKLSTSSLSIVSGNTNRHKLIKIG